MRERGVTLIELMIGMVLSLVISGALATLLVNMSRSHAELDRSSRQIENGRYAIELLADEIKLAGFYGDVKQAGAVFTNPEPCETTIANLGWDEAPITIPDPVEGRLGTLADVPDCVTDASGHVANTGIIVLRRLSIVAIPAASVSGNNPHLQTSRCSEDPFVPPLILSTVPADFILQSIDCATKNSVRRYLTRIYYVAPCSDCARDQIPTLKRLELTGGAMVETPLAEGIQEVQYEFGFDMDSNGVPDRYLTTVDGVAGSAANNWSNVMAVRIWLLSRSTEETNGYTDTKTYALGLHGARGPFNDRFKRRVYTQIVRLGNPAGWREQ